MGLPKTIAELDRIKAECRSMVTKRASASGAAAIIPAPGADIAADVAIMLELLPAINRKFGLSQEQIDELDPDTKKMILILITSAGSELIGKVITKQIVAQLLKKVGARVAVKSVVKFVPFLGQAAAAGISFGAMKYLGNSHIDECYAIAKRYIENSN
ncbi:hypothetical protein [Bacillus sp. T33-2]|uniref:hypothetical protein n=1 Tax=Bacillus sp. T33-2 TaxID=2054168 RepID=UPI000C77B9FE|nr:hypothetical protein [Bacillus sp. T33-2]PLR94429.1 hypothetical protein CVD19_17215 [Bacillus sp. T33-2]